MLFLCLTSSPFLKEEFRSHSHPCLYNLTVDGSFPNQWVPFRNQQINNVILCPIIWLLTWYITMSLWFSGLWGNSKVPPFVVAPSTKHSFLKTFLKKTYRDNEHLIRSSLGSRNQMSKLYKRRTTKSKASVWENWLLWWHFWNQCPQSV